MMARHGKSGRPNRRGRCIDRSRPGSAAVRAAMRLLVLPLALPFVALLLVSCTLRHPFQLHPEPRPDAAADMVPQSFEAGTTKVAPPERWWESFQSTELDDLMNAAFAGNLQLASAWTRLRQAEALVRMARAEGRLQASGSASGNKTERRSTVMGDSSVRESHSGTLGLSLSYEVDLWGRIRASSEAALQRAKATRYDVDASALMLSGQVADTWLRLKSAQNEIRVLESQIATTRRFLEGLVMRQHKGMSAAVDVLQQKQQLANLESAVWPVRERLSTRRLQLAYLLGLPPDRAPACKSVGFPPLPPLPDPGLPATLLAQRPDIQAAWSRLMAQDWSVTAARADRLPALRLTGRGSTTAEDLPDLFDQWILSLAGDLVLPLLDGGRRRAEVERRRALADEYLLAYRDTVLTACHEVQDTLTTERWRARYVAGLEHELAVARETLDESRRRYLKGLSDYLPVLTALLSTHRTERLLVSARANLLVNRVALYRALGGTWTTDVETSP